MYSIIKSNIIVPNKGEFEPLSLSIRLQPEIFFKSFSNVFIDIL
jgi:hypothetical protein